ncbi:ABC-2 type transport system permease protein [Bacillus pakistanensis]|uniref:ABC-2 type transport system permease protein n=1 Tax=Rossellomorea pakistanensis TaxID=992288 RepID=A0ABS2NI18_9BACI|nr:ABC transporter permease [Bacillus pakistanensis]MBM7587419.1 ABC-2 type transport system permease protein [Bacillus pakistanensis]
MDGHLFNRTIRLSCFILRRDRIRISLWLIGLSFFTLIVPVAFTDLYTTQQARDAMAETMRNPAMTAMVGPGNLDHYTLGAMTTHQMLLFTAVVVGLMSILLVNRHTRSDEEDGRIEMVRSLPVGRLSTLNATLFVLCITNAALALITGFGLYVLDIESMGLEGSLLYGAALGATGIIFAGVTAVFAQLSESSRGTIGYSIAILIITYLIRAFGDVSNETLSLFSPLGWVTQTEAYSSNHWWPVLLLLGSSVILFIIAYLLNAVRDLGAGFLPARPGRKHASAFLQSPIGLALKLQRTGIIAWAVGMFVMGLSYGSVLGDLESFLGANDTMQQLFKPEDGRSLSEQFIPMLMVIMALLGTVPPLMAINKLYGDEKKNRIEHLLGRAVSRTRLMFCYLVLSAVNGFVMISLAALGLWAAGTSVMESGLDLGMVSGAAVVYYPAMLVMIGIAVFLIGFTPKINVFIWLYVFYSFIVLYLGGLFQFPDWVGQISPYGHIPQLPVEEMEYGPVAILIVIALVLMIAGFIGYNKRDIEG